MAYRSITTKYGLAITLIVALAILSMAGTQAWFERESTLAQIRKLQAVEATAARDKLDAYLANLQRFIFESAALPFTPGLLGPQDQADDFRRLLKIFPEINSLASVTAKGEERVFVARIEPDRLGSARRYACRSTAAWGVRRSN